MSYLAQRVDPMILMKAQKDPQFWKAINEISNDPRMETMKPWLDDPNIGPFVSEMWKVMMEKQI